MCGITGWATLDSHAPPPEGAKELLHANAGVGGYEIRPLLVFQPGGKVA